MANVYSDPQAQQAADWLASISAPPAVVNVVTNAIDIVGQAKAGMIARLTANCNDQQRAALTDIYNKMEPRELQAIVASLPTQNRQPQAVQPIASIPALPQPLYVGNAGGFDGGVYDNDAVTANGIEDEGGLDAYGTDDE